MIWQHCYLYHEFETTEAMCICRFLSKRSFVLQLYSRAFYICCGIHFD